MSSSALSPPSPNNPSAPLDGKYWEGRYQKQDTPWDQGMYHPHIDEFISRFQSELKGSQLASPGSGPGHDAIRFAKAGASVVGFDIATSAISKAEENLAAARSSQSASLDCQFVLEDIFDLKPPRIGSFDFVFEHTCYCAIPRRMRNEYVKSVSSMLKKGGHFLAIIFLNPRDDPNPDLGPPFNASVEEIYTKFSPFFEIVHEGPIPKCLRGRDGRERAFVMKKK